MSFYVAGMSSRFGGKLKQLDKVGINGETLIEVSVNEALVAPFSKIIFITNELTEHYFIDIFRDEYKESQFPMLDNIGIKKLETDL